MKTNICKTSYLVAMLLITVALAHAQVGINTTSPDSTALLDIRYINGGTPVGVLFPNLDTSERKNKRMFVSDGMIVFDRQRKMLYYYDAAIEQWVALNPVGIIHDDTEMRDIRPQDSEVNNLNMSLGLPVGEKATAKLDINGNVRVRSDMRVDGCMKVNGSDTVQQNLIVKGAATLQLGLQVGSNGATTFQNPTTIKNSLAISEELTVGGNINAGNSTITAKTLAGCGTTPLGGIIMWSGSTYDFDDSGNGKATTKMDGWALCYGQTVNGYTTPNLQGRFIVGYNRASSPTPQNVTTQQTENYGTIGNTGGETLHQLSEPEMPSHTHTIKRTSPSSGSGDREFVGGSRSGSNENINSDPIGTAGGSQAHENRPPYYVLAFIMRVQ